MKINLVLAPEQSVSTLIALQHQHPKNVFYLGKISQLAGTNVLIFDAPEVVTQFERPLGFEIKELNGHLEGNIIHQIAFQVKNNNNELIAKLLTGNSVMAQNENGKAEYMIWSFWSTHEQLATFLASNVYQQMNDLMKNPYTTTYQHVTDATQLSLTSKMRDFDKEWWG
ncbi:hypothetical protein GCM10025879_06990 [Leuconostoc litchii]|uniref:Monooxygenase n=1 Tax=Leuconostoc litchii TaxID=1981069 RepID=A0A6P2CNJ6_9LACO|nr:hypothetical protein [Leuconostoc litchii]TYC47436.1 hypothetical protein ESZ47_04670 [Leuconostoc litchii]GMA69453.1 hypothetical protein GCM10025879_06990 [Leuconostoc litchii]